MADNKVDEGLPVEEEKDKVGKEAEGAGKSPDEAGSPPGSGAKGPQEGADVSGSELDEDEEQECSPEMLALYEDSLRDITEGEIVKGMVVSVEGDEVLVDVGFKSEGIISLSEFSDREGVKPGLSIDVFLEKMEDQDGLVVLSKQKADFAKVWDRVKDASDSGAVVEGRLVRKIKGGLVVDLFGVEAFLPGSQVALRQVQNIDQLLNQTLRFKIIKLNKRRRNIVVSRRVVLEEERAEQKATILKELAKDQIREGVVKNITDFGAFVDLGGIDGLLHVTDMSWGRVSHPSEVLAIGNEIKVKVLSFEPERERISLGLKQLTPYPWENVDEKFKVGSKVRGKVVSITDYGAFVELEKGVEGLVHVSEMSWTRHVRHPSKVLAIGDTIEAVVLKVDKEHEKISLGLKQVEPDPWLTLDEKYPIGTRLTGKVRNLTNFGAFVEIEEGIDGLVHISDMSWTRRISHASEVLKKGDRVEVVVLNIDKDNRRISLGFKQVTEDPWPALVEQFPLNSTVSGKVVRLLERGVIVDLGDEIEGFVPFSQLGIDDIGKPSDAFRVEDELDLKVIRVDPEARRIVLSLRAYLGELPLEVQEETKKKYVSRAMAAEAESREAPPEPGQKPAEELPASEPEEKPDEQVEPTERRTETEAADSGGPEGGARSDEPASTESREPVAEEAAESEKDRHGPSDAEESRKPEGEPESTPAGEDSEKPDEKGSG
ncbi:MAG: 30S ribosomal protein S1 [Candidatus Eiseniibacteriota bacterium]|nr:MAG: 30S ribosomal protein S1 [Candidatus Eisenbacteria bacterium]